jgi:hypothetical protein
VQPQQNMIAMSRHRAKNKLSPAAVALVVLVDLLLIIVLINAASHSYSAWRQAIQPQQQALQALQAVRQSADQVRSKKHAMCQKLGGTWDSVACQIGYRSPEDGRLYQYIVSFDSAGNVRPSGPPDAATCATYYGPGVTGHWHTDTDICST